MTLRDVSITPSRRADAVDSRNALGVRTAAATAAALFVSFASFGCSTTGTGPSLKLPIASMSSAAAMEQKIKTQARRYSIEYSASALLKPQQGRDAVIVIGALGKPVYYNWLSRRLEFRRFEKRALDWGYTPPTREEFDATFEGWVNISTFSIPFIGGVGTNANLLTGQSKQFEFSGFWAASIAGPIASDLVWARSTDHGFLIIQGALCKASDPAYAACARQYERGFFDASTGKPLSRSQAESSDEGIDPVSLKRRAGPYPEPARGGIGPQ